MRWPRFFLHKKKPPKPPTIRRINIYGGPAIGKSTMACDLFARFKRDGKNIELVSEYIKFWTFINRQPQGFDQFYTLAKQVHQEDTMLRSGVDMIISDSPVLLSVYYAKRNQTPGLKHLVNFAKYYERAYPAVHIMLRRCDNRYSSVGRFHGLQEAVEIDRGLKIWLTEHTRRYHLLPADNPDEVYAKINNLITE